MRLGPRPDPLPASREVRHRHAALVDRRLRPLLGPLVGLSAVLVLGLAAFVWHSTIPGGVDRSVGDALYATPGSAIRSAFSAATILGSPGAVIAMAFAIAAWTWFRLGNRFLAAFCPAVVICATVAESAAKSVVGRTRPATATLAHVHGQSFPSGHATVAVALAVAASLLVVAVGVRRQHVVVVVLVAYAVMISLSRIVLGVHFLTDVVAGGALGVGVTLSLAALWTRTGRSSASKGPMH